MQNFYRNYVLKLLKYYVFFRKYLFEMPNFEKIMKERKIQKLVEITLSLKANPLVMQIFNN